MMRWPGLVSRRSARILLPQTLGANGHGCGHNLLGHRRTGRRHCLPELAGAARRLQGRFVSYGCPGEEGGSGKTFMVREGMFDDVDAALTWHPEAYAGMFSTSTLANIQAAWRFSGTAGSRRQLAASGRSSAGRRHADDHRHQLPQ